MTALLLEGVRPRPLASYLSGLGVLRVVASQADPTATARWQGSRFVLDSPLSSSELRTFLLDAYQPAPLVAPWNGSDQGGYRPGTAGRAAQQLKWLDSSTSERLSGYRAVAAKAREVVDTPSWQSANLANDKAAMVSALRNALPDGAIAFLDAAVALTADGVTYPPMFGTGGNLGRLDLVVNYLIHLQAVLEPRSSSSASMWLDEVLDGTPVPGVASTLGQFDYQGAGGANQGRSGAAPARVNPWAFVLTMEGALLFAATATRRLGAHQAKASAPFTVASTAAGYPSAAPGEASKGEVWVPLWDRPWSIAEVESVFSEGRATWSGRQARDGTDFLRAVRSLGFDRGITGFERFAFLERHGQSPAAISVGSVRVGGGNHRVRLTTEIDGWVRALNRGADDRVPAAVRTARTRVNRALFAAADDPARPQLRRLLEAVASAERAVGRSSSFRSNNAIAPVPALSEEWDAALRPSDPSAEYLIARLLAFGHDRWDRSLTGQPVERSLRELLRPVVVGPRGTIAGFRADGPVVPGFGSRPIVEMLADVAVVRARTAPRVADADLPPLRGIRPQFVVHREDATARDPRAPSSIVEAFAAGSLDERELARWLEVLLLLRPNRDLPLLEGRARPTLGPPSPLWRVFAPWFGQAILLRPGQATVHIDGEPSNGWRLTPVVRSSWPSRLRRATSTQLTALVREVGSGYAAARLRPAFSPEAIGRSASAAGPDPLVSARLLASLMVPTRLRDLADLVDTHLFLGDRP